MAIDYSLITESATYKKGMRHGFISGRIISVVLLAVLVVLILSGPLIFFLILGLVVFILIKIPASKKKHEEHQSILAKFSELNSFSYTPTPYFQKVDHNTVGTPLELPYKALLISKKGQMKGSIKGLNFEYTAGTIDITEPELKRSNNSSSSLVTILTVDLPILMPKLLVDTRNDNLFGLGSKADKIAKVYKYNLEGNFSKFYNVYAEKNDQINVLSILTPEVMDKLLNHKYFDIWINGDKLVIFTGLIDYFYATPEIIETAEMLIKEIDHISRAVRQA